MVRYSSTVRSTLCSRSQALNAVQSPRAKAAKGTAGRRQELDLDYGARLYRLVPVGPRRDQVERAADQLLEAIDVGPGPRR